jgi:hypothetical protein
MTYNRPYEQFRGQYIYKTISGTVYLIQSSRERQTNRTRSSRAMKFVSAAIKYTVPEITDGRKIRPFNEFGLAR